MTHILIPQYKGFYIFNKNITYCSASCSFHLAHLRDHSISRYTEISVCKKCHKVLYFWAFQLTPVIKNLPLNAGRRKKHRFDLWVRKSPWRRAWQPAPVLLLGECHGQRSLAGFSSELHRVGHD